MKRVHVCRARRRFDVLHLKYYYHEHTTFYRIRIHRVYRDDDVCVVDTEPRNKPYFYFIFFFSIHLKSPVEQNCIYKTVLFFCFLFPRSNQHYIKTYTQHSVRSLTSMGRGGAQVTEGWLRRRINPLAVSYTAAVHRRVTHGHNVRHVHNTRSRHCTNFVRPPNCPMYAIFNT